MNGKNVCVKDCPDRSAGCHANWEKYQAYYRENAERRDQRIKEKQAEMLLSEVSKKRAARCQRRMKHRMKLPGEKWGR